MNDALTISFIGGSMVFVGLILLWIMMDILVRLTSREKAPETAAASEIAGEVTAPAEDLLKPQAAAAAVAVALARAASGHAAGKSQEKNALSPWLSAHRNRQLNHSNALPRRKND
jgi:Na+-transporting methylmalonyl-CoA/oxaloacetate decarboxylase gamma subunit